MKTQSSVRIALGLLLVLAFAQAGSAQSNPTDFGNNYFVTGDYVVGGVGLRGRGDATGFATGTINIPDPNSIPATGVPPGADVVGAFLFWQTVESTQVTFAGQNGFFRGYPITGELRGNPNAPVSWSAGGCSGDSQGSKTIRTYRADVLSLLPVDGNGIVQPNASYQVRLADSGSNGGGTPLTLGATLVLVYRIISPNVPLNSVIIYDGAYAPANGSTTMSQPLHGFYQAAANPVSKLTHIVGNGQNNKFEMVFLNGTLAPSPYGSLPPFPGYYNGSWDNPTWSFSGAGNPVLANSSSANTMVTPTSSNSGCVSWGAIVFSTTVQDTDNDGLLDVWEQNQGYCDAAVNGGVCSSTDASWVALPGASSSQKDLFIQLDYTCSIVNPDGTCDTTNGVSFLPPAGARTMMTNAFAARGINLHLFPTNAIPEPVCVDDLSTNPPALCSFPDPDQPGIVGWKAGVAFLKNQPLNYPDESTCAAATSPACIRRFQHGKKDSYHYVLSARGIGIGTWGFIGGSLMSVVVDGSGAATFTTSSPTNLQVNPTAGLGRVTVADAINFNLNGTYLVTSVSNVVPYGFTIQTVNVPAGVYNINTDPDLSVASGRAGTGSGVSDVGGADSLITLGLWGVDGLSDQVQAGTLMHEVGHSLALTHGGFYYDTPSSYVVTPEPNCKPNFQSVMNYLFQVDLLDNGMLDYSGQSLNTLNEQLLSGVAGLTPTPTAYAQTRWYAVSPPMGVGTQATHFCDGTPIPASNPTTMYRVEGAANPVTPAWTSGQDINFDGNVNASLRGYNDWANLDMRQIGATGSLSTAGGITRGGTGITRGGTGITRGGTGITRGGTGITRGGTGITRGGTGITKGGTGITRGGTGVGEGELTRQAANSVTRPPRQLTGSLTTSPRFIRLSWTAPTFGQIGSFNIYRAVNGIPVAPAYATVSGSTTSFIDQNTVCGPTYTYFVTAVLAGTNPPQESVPSNSVSLTNCVPPYTFIGFNNPMATADPPNTGSYSGTFNKSKSITAKWSLLDTNGNTVTNVNANTLVAVGPFQPMADGTCRTTQVPVYAACSGNSCPLNAVVLFSPTESKGSSSLRISGSQFVFNWDTKTTPPGPNGASCYVMELDLDSGQVFRTGVKLQ